MDKAILEELEEKLKKELREVETELKSVGRRNPDNPADWEAVPEDKNVPTSDSNEAADRFEAYEENIAILDQLEIRYNNIKKALKNMEEGNYGMCNKCGKQIEIDRLRANPAAQTCKEHFN